jgi:hypothetical protein
MRECFKVLEEVKNASTAVGRTEKVTRTLRDLLFSHDQRKALEAHRAKLEELKKCAVFAIQTDGIQQATANHQEVTMMLRMMSPKSSNSSERMISQCSDLNFDLDRWEDAWRWWFSPFLWDSNKSVLAKVFIQEANTSCLDDLYLGLVDVNRLIGSERVSINVDADAPHHDVYASDPVGHMDGSWAITQGIMLGPRASEDITATGSKSNPRKYTRSEFQLACKENVYIRWVFDDDTVEFSKKEHFPADSKLTVKFVGVSREAKRVVVSTHRRSKVAFQFSLITPTPLSPTH